MGDITGEPHGFQIPIRNSLSGESLLDDAVLDDEEEDERDGRPREGLPPTFRMRHDAHYVDQLTERSAPHAVRLIAIGDIDCCARASAAAADVQTLASSMRDVGVLQPLLVRPASGRYQLISGARRLEAAAVAGLRHVPCIVHETDDAMVENIRENANLPADAERAPAPAPSSGFSGAVATELAESLEAASTCLALNSGSTRGTFAGKVAKELLAIEVQRAARAARAAAFLASPSALTPRDMLLSALVHDVVSVTDAARRMVGVKLEVAIADREGWMRGDAQLLTLALAGAVDALLAQVTAPATLRLSAKSPGVSPTVSIELSGAPADGPPAPAGFFDARNESHPWGAWAGLLLGAAAQAAEAHGGHAEIRAHAGGECTIAFVLPRR